MSDAVIEPTSTRDRMIAEARELFADRGFYGVSIAQIAAELGLTKQALLHHFGTKAKLYGLVLEQIANELAELRPGSDLSDDPAEQLVEYFVAMISDTPEKVSRSRLLMREILDNRARAEMAGSWYLKSFLEELTAMLRAVPRWTKASDEKVLAAIIQLLGAVNYHAVSGPTFRGIFGAQSIDRVDAAFENQLRITVGAVLKTGPAD
ncbi:TetR/AcrR family transcriptional regulator [Altererythrobacter ishigakiensis]|uniref:TetR family transcriptional regulator n=1 Tax=Altererythrobacter ishigakiensis TaxID=476157 RepID=A0A562UU79_9SPHN|nr:TetR/AcrR family transcriptional regulator [Altererythrobacter ishigakiensis]TWJ09202.1 TetR family transcriptional regulator [Altererythrobacter ishigakiensis]